VSPTISVPNPYYAIAGSAGFPMQVVGYNFTATCVVEWNGSPLATVFVSSEFLNVQIPALLVGAPGSARITVKDTSSGLASSAAIYPILSPAAATAGVVQLISVAPDGSAANGDSAVAASISQTGRYVAFQSAASNLTSDPANQYAQIFLRDTCISAASSCAPSTQLVSVTDDGAAPNDPNRNSAVSADGRYVAFDSGATNILPNSGLCGPELNCVYLRDMCTGVASGCTPTTVLASVATDGTILDGANPTITPDGRYVAFNSTGSSAGVNQVVVRDTCNGAPAGCTPSTFTDSLNGGGQPGNENSLGQQLSSDGRYAAFITWSTNMQDTSAPANGSLQSLWVRDTCLGAATPCTPTTTRDDVSSNGTPNNGNLAYDAAGSISDNGRYVSFSADYTATNLVPQNVNNLGNVYWRDTCTGAPAGCQPSTILASVGNDGSIANSGSHQQSMDESGRFVVFTSIATNLVAFDNFAAGSWQEIYGRDTCAGVPAGCFPSTVRLAVSLSVPNQFITGNFPSGNPVISGDGHYVVFLSNSSDFFPSITVQNSMVYLAKTGY
jgi:Tol biopolymer transport system component